MQNFYIKKNSLLPQLRLELIQDGRNSFNKIWDAIQDADITFTMINKENNSYKILNAPAYIKLKNNDSCEDEYVICYDWKKRDTKEEGVYQGIFNINFRKELVGESIEYPKGELIIPIREDLEIIIK